MRYSSKRGRPKKQEPGKDLGTIELQQKRKFNLTTEPLDIIYHKDLISDDQYQAGNRLRWLYSLKYGVASVSAYDHSQINGRNINITDLVWLSERELELEAALDLLSTDSHYNIICDICIFLKYSSFKYIAKSKFHAQIYIEEIDKFREGLDILSEFFRTSKIGLN